MNEKTVAYWMEDDFGHPICTDCSGDALYDADGEAVYSRYCPTCGAHMKRRESDSE